MDPATLEALGREVVYVQWFVWLDIVGDPLRAVSGERSIAIGAGETGDPDLDGFTFLAIPSELVDVSDVQHSQTGSDTVTVRLSGLPLVNSDLLDLIGDRARWRKREARMWFRLLNPTIDANGKITAFTPLPLNSFYSGYLVDMAVESGAEDQSITVSIENYQAALSEASGLTYLHQNEFDAADDSASQTLAAANGMQKAGVVGGFSGGGSSGGGSSRGGSRGSSGGSGGVFGGGFRRDGPDFRNVVER